MFKNMQNKGKILVLELWGIGDVVLCTGALRQLRINFPDSKIILLAKEYAREVLYGSNSVDEIITYDFPWTKFRDKYILWRWDWIGLFKLIKKLRRERLDLIIDARGDIRNNFLSFLIGATKRVGYAWTGGGFFLTDIVRCPYSNLHRVDAWNNLIKHLGFDNIDICPTVKILRQEQDLAIELLKNIGIKRDGLLVGIHPGAGVKIRCWPLERFVNIAQYLKNKGCEVVIFIEPQGYGNSAHWQDCHKLQTNLRQFISLAKELDFLICNDGGAMHVAAAVGTPVVAIFGPQRKELFGPYGKNNEIVIKEDISCRPCSDYCKYKKAYCLTDISEKQVMNSINIMIDKIERGEK